MTLFGGLAGARPEQHGNERGQQMTPEQRETAVQMGAKFAPVAAYAGPAIGIPVYYLISAAVLLGIVKIMSSPARFQQVFAVMCYAGLTGLIVTALSIVVMF